MTGQTEQLQQLWHLYEAEHDNLPAGAREVVEWAVRERKLELPRIDPLDVASRPNVQRFARGICDGAKWERYRVNHAIRVTKNGVQMTFWDHGTSRPLITCAWHSLSVANKSLAIAFS